MISSHTEDEQQVIIVGAGIAGLILAHGLKKVSYPTPMPQWLTVFKARNTICSLRERF